MRSDRSLKAWYNRINKKFFEGELTHRVCVRWVTPEDQREERGCDKEYFGWCRPVVSKWHDYEIVLSTRINNDWTRFLSTLVHEMCHVATECGDDHDEMFSQWHELLTLRGIFRKGALLRGFTLF